MTVTRKMYIMIMIFTITLQALGNTENSVPPGSGSSPTEIPSTRITQDNLLEFEDCPLDNATTACDTAYTASAKKCQSKLSLNQLLQHFFPNVDIQSLINNIVQPEKFDCTKFYINTCKDYVEFQGQSREDIDLVPNRLRIGDATLILRVLYKPLTLYYAAVYFEINGNVYSDSRKLQISCSKDFDNSPITMSMEARQFTIQELERLFSVSAFKSQEMPASVEELKTLSLSSAEIKGYYYSDGYFEFIMKGKVETSTVFSSSMLYLIIQKQVNDEITVGVIAHFAAASFRDILSGVIGEDLPYEIPIIWQEKSDIALHVSSRGIQKVKNADFNRIFRFFIAGRAAVIKGVSLCAAFPFQKFVSQNYPSLKGTYLPLTFLFIADVKKNRIRISFATDINLSLSSALLILTSETNFYAQLTELFEKDSMAEIKWMDLLLRQYEIQISISLTNSVSVVKGFPQIYHFEIILQKHLHTSWKLSGKGKGKISSTEFQTEFKELSNGKFSLAGKTNMVSSQSLFQTFAEYSGLLEIVSQFQFLNFKITNVFISSKVESHLNFRLTGKPEILDSAEAQYSELILYNSTKTSPGLAFGILLKGAGFEALLAKMFGERQQRPAWVQKVDCAIMISNENQNAASKQLTFKISEFNKFILKRGVSIGLTIYLTGDCKGDGLCELLKSQTSASSSEIFLYGRLAQTELEVEWRTVSMQLSTHIELIDVSFRIFGGQKMSYLLEATMKLAVYGLSFKGIISSDVSGGLSIDMQLGTAWKHPFAIKGCLFADMSYKSSLSSFKNLEYFDMEGQVYIGTVHLQRRITGNAIVTINTANAQQSYFYSKVQSLELSGLLDAFEIQYQLPMVMQYAKFIGPVIVGYSHNPLSIRIEDLNLKLENKLTIKGMLSIWGHLGQFLITISEGMLRLEASMPYLSLDNGFVKMTSICDCPDLKKFDGPSLIAEFHESSVDVRLFGKLTCLGLSKAINVSIDDGGFSFELSGAVYGVFESDLMLTAGYGNPSQANLTVTGCIPKAIPNVTYEVMTLLKDIRDDTREFLHSTRSRINELGVILEQSHKRMDIHNEQASSYKSKIEKEVSSLIQLQGKAQPCLNECKKVCMGVPGWSDDALTFDGYAIGSPKWKHCAHEVSDIVCVVRCLGRKVIKNVKAFNDQKKLQELLNVYERSTEQKKLSRGFLQKAVYVVGGMVTKLEKVDDKLSVGMSVVKSMIGNKFVELVSVDKVCIKGLLRDAVESQVRFIIKGKLIGKAVAVDVTASIDASLWKKLAVAMVEKMFPNATSFKDEKMKLKKMLKDIDIEKENVLNELEYSIRKSDMETVSRKNVVTEEEDKLRTLAYKELPRYTLGNDRVVRLFSRSSPWALMQSNDPLEAAFSFRNKTRISKLGNGKARYDTEKGTKKSVCASVHDAMQDYADILRVASGIAENFFEEKIAYLKSKNKHLATLRDIEDQIKSDCYLENCTVGEMNDALRYAIKAKNGFIQWMDSVKQQLKKHDRFALQVASKDIQTVIEKDKGMTMKEFIRSISNTFTKSYKRTLGEHQRGLSQLDQLDLDLRDILLNSRNRRVTTTAPLIFSMKNRFKSIKRTVVNECARKRETLSRKPND